MKILYISDAIAIWGGLERVLVEKINYLADRYGYNIYLVTVNQGDHPVVYSLSKNVIYKDLCIQFHKQYFYKGVRKLVKRIQLKRLFVRRLDKYVKTISPDVIVSVRPELTYGIVKIKGDIPLLFESHGSRFSQAFIHTSIYSHIKVFFKNRAIEQADFVVALTNGDAEDWRRIHSNVYVIQNLVHLNDTNSYSNCETKTIIYVGRFSGQKNIGSLLEIWKIVYQKNPDWSLHIFGGYGEEQDQILSRIKEMNANIVVNPPTSNIFEMYKKSSILLLTSRYEPFGLVLPEAMSCGIPVVAFDCPYGPADIITDGFDGFLIDNYDNHKFADKVCMLISDVSLRKKMGKAGILSSERFSADTIMPMWKKMFEMVVDNK